MIILIVNFHQILTWNYDFDLYKGFSMKKMTKFIIFLKKIQIAIFLWLVLVNSQKYKRILLFFPIFISRMYPNYFLDNCHYEKIFFKKQLSAILHQFARENNYSSPTYIVPLMSPTYFCMLPTQLHKYLPYKRKPCIYKKGGYKPIHKKYKTYKIIKTHVKKELNS